MNWLDHRNTWPHHESSQFVETQHVRWHVQSFGAGPDIVLIHGAGGSCHSWRDCAPILAKTFRVTVLDLPGQGFSQPLSRNRFGLEATSADVAALLEAQGIVPAAIVGHSAGCAIALQLALDWPGAAGSKIIGLNGALGNFDGLAGIVFPAMAKLLALNPLTAPIFSRTASSMSNVRRLIHSTGSPLPDEGIAYYQMLVSDAGHVSGALSMMANWSLDALLEALPKITQELCLIAGTQDKTVPAEVSERAAAKTPNGVFRLQEGLGHLMHEEAPEVLCRAILEFLDD